MKSNDAKWRENPDREFNLSAKQATALRQLTKGCSLAVAQGMIQTTFGALYRRKFIEIKAGRVQVTLLGHEALYRQSRAHVDRAETMHDAPFAAVIRALGFVTAPRNRAAKVIALRKAS
jgi:hypothetical protein